jgi:glycosyltransferase involved in cell wall biosynthesis
MYTGAVSKQFGLQNLVEGFLKSGCSNCELHIYGNGDYVNDLKELCKIHDNIKYFGVVPNEELVKKQQEATFLVNPRPVGGEYTKYSFPSKNIEYMISGVPMITTKLPCITSEYDPFVFYFVDDTVDGIATTIREMATMDRDEARQRGELARGFVSRTMNNREQMRKILDMVCKR